MVEAERGVEPRGADRPRDYAAQNGVAVVEAAVDPVHPVSVSAEVGNLEDSGPVAPGGLPLDIGRVARTALSGQVAESGVRPVDSLEDLRLVLDLRHDDL